MEFDRAAVTKERAAGAMTGRAGSKKESIRRFARKKRLRILYFQIYSVHLHHQNGLCRDGTGESVAQQVEHNTFNVGVLGSSPSGFTKYPATYRLPDIFLRGALTFGYLLAETPNRPADDIGGSSVRIGLPGRRSSPSGFAKMAGQSRQKTALAKYLRGLSFPDSLNG